MSTVLAASIGANVGLAICLYVAHLELRFERKWRQEEEHEHERWFWRALEAKRSER